MKHSTCYAESSDGIISPEEILAGSAGHCTADPDPSASVKAVDLMPERKIIAVAGR